MTFTYSPEILTTDLAKVRLEVGDTELNAGVLPGGKNLSDEEIQRYLDNEANVYGAASAICSMVSTRWSAQATLVVGAEGQGRISVRFAQRAAELRRMAARGALYAGGLSQSRKDAVEDDSDRVAPAFTRELDQANSILGDTTVDD